MKDLYSLLRTSLAGVRVLLLMTVVLGIAYPLAITGVAQVAFPWQADGSLIDASGEHVTVRADAVGSALLGQVVIDERLFQPRPSAAGEGYDSLASAGSNLGPQNADLVAAIETRKAEIARREGVDPSNVPPDAVTASASGLDPHISEEYAAIQVARVAELTGLGADHVRDLVAAHTDGRTFGVLGEPHVNVLTLNTAVLAALG